MVAAADEATVAVAHEFRQCTTIGSDDRESARHRLTHSEPEPFQARRKDKDVGEIVVADFFLLADATSEHNTSNKIELPGAPM